MGCTWTPEDVEMIVMFKGTACAFLQWGRAGLGQSTLQSGKCQGLYRAPPNTPMSSSLRRDGAESVSVQAKLNVFLILSGLRGLPLLHHIWSCKEQMGPMAPLHQALQGTKPGWPISPT